MDHATRCLEVIRGFKQSFARPLYGLWVEWKYGPRLRVA